MSVLIKGMDMPNRCDECILTSGGECIFLGIDAEMDSVDMNCPLVEVKTPHGRLIDATPLENATATKKDYPNDNTILIPLGAVLIKPTVIEAEE